MSAFHPLCSPVRFAAALATALLLTLPQIALAQKVIEIDGRKLIKVWDPTQAIPTTDRVRILGYSNYFGDDAPVMSDVVDLALLRAPQSRFDLSKKLAADGWSDNSCAAAASDMYDAVTGRGTLTLPEGWEIRQVGTLGDLTTAENAAAVEGQEVYNWWANDEFIDTNFDPLNPPSYAHSLNIVQSPDGDYYTIDNWQGGVRTKRVYPIDDEATYFSTTPGETDLTKSSYKLSGLDERGRPWDVVAVPPDEPPPPPEEIESDPPPTSEPVEVEVLTSADPNDKLGLLGAGTERYVTPEEAVPYLIRFENMPDASAPAQEVLVRDTLDARVFDLTTFVLGEIRFGDRRVRVPPGRRAFSTRVPLADDRFEVLITAGLAASTGIVTWRFTTLDRETGDLPFDPLDGFLPPNQAPPEGEGSVAFTVALRPGLPSGTVVRNQARIFFDLNDPIDTPPWVNTLDTEPPVSAVQALAGTSADSVFTVQWAGTDNGSGVREYDVYLSIDDGRFFRWLSGTFNTEETFVGSNGRTYAFFSVARDATGNVEALKTKADATTVVVVGNEDDPSLPERVTLAAPYPNPAVGAMTVPFGLPSAGRAEIEVFDLLGRRVAVLATGDQAAGWHSLRWDLGRIAAGLYVLRLQADGNTETRRVTVLR